MIIQKFSHFFVKSVEILTGPILRHVPELIVLTYNFLKLSRGRNGEEKKRKYFFKNILECNIGFSKLNFQTAWGNSPVLLTRLVTFSASPNITQYSKTRVEEFNHKNTSVKVAIFILVRRKYIIISRLLFISLQESSCFLPV